MFFIGLSSASPRLCALARAPLSLSPYTTSPLCLSLCLSLSCRPVSDCRLHTNTSLLCVKIKLFCSSSDHARALCSSASCSQMDSQPTQMIWPRDCLAVYLLVVYRVLLFAYRYYNPAATDSINIEIQRRRYTHSRTLALIWPHAVLASMSGRFRRYPLLSLLAVASLRYLYSLPVRLLDRSRARAPARVSLRV